MQEQETELCQKMCIGLQTSSLILHLRQIWCTNRKL